MRVLGDRVVGVLWLCVDFIFVTENLASRVRDVTVDMQTQASDHQPVLIEMAD